MARDVISNPVVDQWIGRGIPRFNIVCLQPEAESLCRSGQRRLSWCLAALPEAGPQQQSRGVPPNYRVGIICQLFVTHLEPNDCSSNFNDTSKQRKICYEGSKISGQFDRQLPGSILRLIEIVCELFASEIIGWIFFESVKIIQSVLF